MGLLSGSLLLSIGLVASFNYVVNPYSIFAVPNITGFNAVKSRADQRGPMVKAHALESVQPRTLILGNSRAEIGFDPDNPAWPDEAKPVYNAALPGTGLGTSLTYLRHAAASGRLRHVVLGIDFLDFRVDSAARVQRPEPKPLLTPMDRLRDSVDALFSVDTALHAFATVRAQREAYPTSLTSLGFNPLREYVALARDEGYYALFRQRNEENARNFLRGPKAIFAAGTRTSSNFETLKALLWLASEKRIKLDLVIYPYHSEMLVLFQRTGLWPLFVEWKRELTSLVSTEIMHYPGSAITLWDFSAPTPLTTDAIPVKNDLSFAVRWYWEAGHFKKELGDRVLARLLGREGAQTEEEFGVILTPANAESHLARTEAALDNYRRSHPAVVTEIDQLVSDINLRQ
jgi:hypothetical protein